MDSRRQETQTAASTTPTTIAETPAPAKRTTTDASRAASVCNKLDNIDKDEQAELAQSPAAIRAKHEERRQRELSKVSESVRLLVGRMRAQ